MLVVDVEAIDDVALAGGDAGFVAAGAAKDGALAVELVPAAEGSFNDDEVLMGEPHLGLFGDEFAVVQLGGFVVVQAEIGVGDALFCVDVVGVGFEVGGEEVFGLLVVLVFEGLVRGDEFGGDGTLCCAGSDESGEKEGCGKRGGELRFMV